MHQNHDLDSLRTADYDFLYQPQQQPTQQDAFGTANMPGDLDMFANTQFFDFDMSEMPENSPIFAENTFGINDGNAKRNVNTDGNATGDLPPPDLLNVDFNYNGYLEYPDSQAQIGSQNVNKPHGQHSRATPRLNKNLPDNSSNDSSPASTDIPYPYSSTTTSTTHDLNKSPSKDSAQTLVQHLLDHPEDAARVAAEEDKRRRNTAASARFRIKKKQREQALEKSAKEMTDRISELETKVSQLEMENKILKDLITEKSGKEVDMDEVKRKVIEATPEAASPKPSTEEKKEKASKEIKVEKASPR